MLRVGQYAIGAYVGYSFSFSFSSTWLTPLCDLLEAQEDPKSTFQEYTENIGPDLASIPIEAGLPIATWTWARLSQTDYNTLVGLMGQVYIHTRLNTGGGAESYDTFLATMARPTGTWSDGEWLDVTCTFTMLEAP